ELDHQYIPHVSYSSVASRSESTFAQEAADFRLGIGLNAADEVRPIREDAPEWDRLDQAFLKDTGVRLRKFIGGLLVLSRWPSAIGSNDLRFCYSAPQDKICEVLVDAVAGMTSTDAQTILGLLLLAPDKIRRLLGKSIIEGDVPLWEHNKRSD